MKNLIILAGLGLVLSLAACGKSDHEKLVEESAANAKLSAGSLADVPRIVVPPRTPAKKKEGEK